VVGKYLHVFCLFERFLRKLTTWFGTIRHNALISDKSSWRKCTVRDADWTGSEDPWSVPRIVSVERNVLQLLNAEAFFSCSAASLGLYGPHGLIYKERPSNDDASVPGLPEDEVSKDMYEMGVCCVLQNRVAVLFC
jgi:hypothetical protein